MLDSLETMDTYFSKIHFSMINQYAASKTGLPNKVSIIFINFSLDDDPGQVYCEIHRLGHLFSGI